MKILAFIIALGLLLGLAVFALRPVEAPKVEPTPTRAAPQTGASSLPSDAPWLGRWERAPRVEPQPAARALYRQAVDMIARGQGGRAAAMFKQIREDYPESRYAARLSVDGPGAAALIGAATLGGALWLKAKGAETHVEPVGAPGGPAAP